MVTEDMVVVAAANQVSTELEGEAVILNLQSGIYYGLGTVGARVWQIIQQPVTLGVLRDTILTEFDVTQERCEADLEALMNQLQSAGLVKQVDEIQA